MRNHSEWYTMKKKPLLRNYQIIKVKIGESASVIHEVFLIEDSTNYNLRKNSGFKPSNPKTVYYGTGISSVLEPKLWLLLSDEYKNLTSLKEFKTTIKNCVPQNFACCLCKTCTQNIDFIQLV